MANVMDGYGKGPIGITGALQLPRMTKAEYDALLAAVLKVGVIETIEMCDCDTWDCECGGRVACATLALHPILTAVLQPCAEHDQP